jgi:hypothetical protein
MTDFIASLNKAQAAAVKAEPSRLEIAAMLYSAEWCDTEQTALKLTDKLIAEHVRTKSYANA